MLASYSLIATDQLDTSFLSDVYASTRASEMAVVPWSSEQKQAFLQMQFEAQNQHYRAQYPNASFNLIKINGKPVGRLYLAELADEIRIIDLTFLPEHFDKNIFVRLTKEVLKKGEQAEKPVQIYLENFSSLAGMLSDLGFQKVGEHGIYFLWRNSAGVKPNTKSAATSA